MYGKITIISIIGKYTTSTFCNVAFLMSGSQKNTIGYSW